VTTLLTGATGFVGSAVLRRLIEAGHKVRVLVRANSDRRMLQGLDCEIVTADLADPESLKPAVRGCEALFHVAADYRLWVRDPKTVIRINVDGTVGLLRLAAAAGVSRIVYTSSVATLQPRKDGVPVNEELRATLADMYGPYKRSKFLAEQVVRRLAANEQIPVVIVQPSTPFGPGDIKPTPTGRVVVDAASGRIPVYVDTGLNVVHVEDVATGHLLAYEKGTVGEAYILGGENRPLLWILETICRLVGRPAPRVRLRHWMAVPVAHFCEGFARLKGCQPMITVDSVRMSRKFMYFSDEKARQKLGYTSRPAIEAFRDAVEWFCAHGYIKRIPPPQPITETTGTEKRLS
jgi:dihydroflavonol-4-reductase